jgi:GH25 family lysozyme M1 (1,4-beta-N-acetylmuramidase)
MKKCCCLILTTLFFLNAALAQSPSEFNEPWKDSSRALVIDPYDGNKLDCAELSKEQPRVVGIIHQATKGEKIKNEKYEARKKKCKDQYNFKWGSYHFGLKGNPEKQAEFYIKTVKSTDDEIIALDIDGIGGNNMTISEAILFITKIFELTGRYPLLYVTGSVRDEIIRNYGSDSVFAKTPLWYARWCNNISCYFPPLKRSAILDKYTFWQFATEKNCRRRINRPRKDCKVGGACPLNTCPLPKPLAGTDDDMDINIYNGTVEELKAKWGKF